jgi:tetratricopeptide (TPR) repeat protein
MIRIKSVGMAFPCLVAMLLLHVPIAEAAGSVRVRFMTSCSPDVQSKFDQGVTMLHSFEYLETARIFDEVIVADPGCAIAYWGAAMSIWHPLWAPPGVIDLERGAAVLAKADGLAATPREHAYLSALSAFFSSTDTTTHTQRARAHETLMGELYMSNLDDPEAAVFYSLAILAASDPRDKSYARQFKSAGLLNWVRISQPTHPGVLHYTIHSYDFPGLAHLALDSADVYAGAAPDSAHAQHMPSHIYTRLGLWERSLASNHDSTRSAAQYTEQAHLPGHYDEGLHSMDYLMYAMLQTARDDEALDLLVSLGDIKRTDTENFKVAYTYASSPARYVLERRAWQEASNLDLVREDFAWEDFGWALSIHFFARGIGAARTGNIDNAHEELATIIDLQRNAPKDLLVYWREELQVHVDAVSSWISLAEGDSETALRLAAAAADREDSVDKHPVTPGEVLPARELYADMLFETGAYEEALQQYRRVLAGSPNRLNTVLGAARSATRSGDIDAAADYYDIGRRQTSHGNRQRTGLAEAWRVANQP